MKSIDRCVRITLVAFLSIAAAHPVAAQLEGNPDFNKGGRTAFQFLKIGIGARQAALGEAGIASVQDVNSVFWNPANLRGIGSTEAAFSYTRWFADMNYAAGGVAQRVGGVGVFALSIASLDYGEIQEALVTGGASGDTRTGHTVSGANLMAGLSYSREFTDRLAIGITAKYLRESLFDFSVGTFAFDVGTSYYLGYNDTRLAMSAQNFSGSVKWLGDESDRTEGYDVPLVFRIGISTNLIGEDAFVEMDGGHQVVVSAEAINTNDFSERVHLGVEYGFGDILALRGGYRFNYAEGNWAVGVGLHPRVSGIALRLDYAYVAYRFLDAPHRLSLSLAW